MTTIRAVSWDGEVLSLLDQRRLPEASPTMELRTPEATADAIRDLVVRGAPAIGITAAYGMVLAARRDPADEALRRAAAILEAARPTAVNLAWAVRRVLDACLAVPPEERSDVAAAEAVTIHDEDRRACRRLADLGADLIPGTGPVEIMTHCNAGALATGGIGTALGVVRALAERGRLARLWSCEARPVLQGARLTAWEAVTDDLPCTLVADSAAATVLATRPVAALVTGADRIAADGTVANKVGTYPLAVLARRHGIPFIVAAPTSTLDPELEAGADIPIEERDGDEVRFALGRRLAPAEVEVYNPAFDRTPPELVDAVVTETGVARPVNAETIAALLRRS